MEALINENKNRKTLSVYFWYTIFFVVSAAITFSFFLIYKKSFVWKDDGLYQEYNAFIYAGNWFRDYIKEIFVNQNFVPPLWEWGLGAGADVLGGSMESDPFYIISAFFPTAIAEVGYAFVIILKLYLAGLTFSAYCKKMGCLKWTTTLAALIYIFCSFVTYASPHHLSFSNPMIFLPMVFLGIEKIIRKESFVLFSISVTLSALSGFYFFYQIIILTIIYVILRFLFSSEYRKPKIVLNNIMKIIFSSIIGVMISALILLPIVMSFVGNHTRISQNYVYDFFYSLAQYRSIPVSLITATAQPVRWAFTGMLPFALIGVFGSFIRRDKNQTFARIYFLIEIIFICFPFFGSLFNGFGYVTNRWTFAWSFMPAFLFAKELPEILKFDIKKEGCLALSCFVYTFLCIAITKSFSLENLIGIVLLMASLFLVIFAPDFKDINLKFKKIKISVKKKFIIRSSSSLLVLVCVFYMAFFRFSSSVSDNITEFKEAGTANSLLMEERSSVWTYIEDDDFYRVDDSFISNPQHNFALQSHQPTTTWYWSITDTNTVNWRRLNNCYHLQNFKFRGLYSRAWLQPQYCAKYFVSTPSKTAQASVPYGFTLRGSIQGYSNEYWLYETSNSLSFGSTYDGIIRLSDYENLSIAERQQAALQNCIIDDDAQVSLKSNSMEFDDYEIPYTIQCDKNSSFSDNRLTVKKADSTLTLTFEDDTQGELYVQFSGLKYDDATQSTITAQCNKAKCNVTHYSDNSTYTEGRTEYLLNLGYSEDERNEITLTFSNKGDYSFDELKVICQPMEKLPEYVKARNEDVLENVSFDTNKISGTIDLEKSKFLCLSLPYSKGWTAYVDGQKVDLLHANIAFSGLELEAGHHEIELKFCTPYIKIGAVLSILGIISLVFCAVLFKNKEHIDGKVKASEHKPDKS